MPTTIDNLLSRMTLEEKIGQMILASIEVSRMDAGTREFLRKNHIGNVILFGKNCAGRAALAQLNAEIQHTVMAENGLPALIAIDQEGGCGHWVLTWTVRRCWILFPALRNAVIMGKLCNPSRIMAAPWPAACGMPGCWPAANISPAMSRPVPIHTSALWWTIPRVTH